MSRLQKSLSLIFLAVFITVSLVIVPQSHAATDLFNIPGVKTMQDYGKEFCDKRSGDLMNLETWYSGKCAPEVDTLSGDGVGFVDIVILQGMEWISSLTFSSPGDTFVDSIKNTLKMFEQLKDIQPISYKSDTYNLASSYTNNYGVIGSLGKFTTNLATIRPASSIDYVNYIALNLQKHHIVSDTYAAGPGYGFSALAPILPLWRAFRNISYMLFAIGFVLYGIMIMFRVKIDSKTAATIQLAIPKLIATLLMITFSYAIVGFLVDISTIADAMAINILRVGPEPILNAGGPLSGIGDFVINVVSGQSLLGGIGSFFVNALTAVMVSPLIFFNLVIGGLSGIVVGVLVGELGIISGFGIIAGIIIIIAVLISYFKLILKLFQAFFGIIINLIFAPIILLGNLLPGSTSFGDWLRSIYGNLAVFPVAIFFLTLSFALMCQPLLSLAGAGGLLSGAITSGIENVLGVNQLSTLSNIWTPPLTIPGSFTTHSGGGSGTLTGSAGSLMLATIGFGLLMMASKYCEMVEKALKTPPFPYGAAIGDALKGGWKGSGTIPSIGNADWYRRTSRATGLTPGTPISAPLPPVTPPITPPPVTP
ncbi:hypothetical protein CO104_01190 [Candidatus Collierbacteria bacterium CG_4_9_14_3_um_filter_43_16]|uniref:Uncharacterized protein n=1 Tax=Candidatus Collierbacteria bacterium CG_4_9_14_3_um_filter_43_16 TaxID=1974532 RepID=A0A2M8BX86_9BACT|nr:MAG: hypothetical protein CO104_01190 [Candidatus Collierbacteria bacterium CG_4_9_14_3_um_filter_43_16]